MAVKKTSDLVPFCHPLPIESCDVRVRLEGGETADRVIIDCAVGVEHKTGVEMEALVGASAAALCVYDMCKALSHDIVIESTRLLHKSGGKRTFDIDEADAAAARPKSFVRAKNLHRFDAGVNTLVTSPRLARVAAELLYCGQRAGQGRGKAKGTGRGRGRGKGKGKGERKRQRQRKGKGKGKKGAAKGVRLYQSTAFFKEPGDQPSAWHQDASASPLRGDTLTLWLALGNVSAAMGPLVFAGGSHRERLGKRRSMAAMLGVRGVPLGERVAHVRARGQMTDAQVRGAGFNISAAQAMRAGDATFHLGWTLHRAAANEGSEVREALSVMYFCDGDSVHRDMLADTPPGADAASRGVPLSASDGPGIVVQLVADDSATWVPWILSRQLAPDRPLANSFTPLLWPRRDQAEVVHSSVA
eukprot:g1483.t1